ncbi:glycosyltransferase family 4 protein [Vibrio sp. 10N.286.52.F8]|uniref:glycosyltransferase family 4 protein n=1 Tax=Vibrio sp. 10N.286.52.F8 TaxID=3229716 RepID=UPI0035526985
MSNNIGVIFPYAESYDSHFGGAIARWVYEVSSRSSKEFEYSIYSASDKNDYGDNVYNSYYGSYCSIVKKLERTFSKGLLLDKLFFYIKKITCRDTIWICSIFRHVKKLDLIIVHNRPKVPALLRMLGFKGKIFLHMHNSHLYHSTSTTVAKLNRSADKIIYCSNFLKNETVYKYPELASISEVIYNGVSDKEINYKNAPKNRSILFAGRIIESKGVIELVKAFNLFRSNNNDYVLNIVGGVSSGSSSQKTKYLIDLENEIKLSKYKNNINFLGYLDHKELLDEMNRSEVLAVPSKWKEPFGMVALEGFVKGCKVIATEDGGIPEILGGNGFYCKCNPESISNAISKAISSDSYVIQNDIGKFTWGSISKKFDMMLRHEH